MESLLYIEPNKYFSYTTDPKIYFKISNNIKKIQVSFYINDDSNLDSFFLNFMEKNSLLESRTSELENKIFSLEQALLFSEMSKKELETNNRENLNLVKKLNQQIDENHKAYQINKTQKEKFIGEILKILKHNNQMILKIKNELKMNKLKIVSLEGTLENKNNKNLILEKKLNEITNSRSYKMTLIENNPDVKNANVDPILHYLEYGWKEGRNPSHIFDNNFYLNDNLDVKEAEINPLIHYIYDGKKEKRRINNKPNFIRIIKKVFYLLYKNPSLWRKFFFVMKTRGIKDSIIKLINKIDSIDKYSESFNISAPYTSLDKLIENLNSDDFSKIMQFFLKIKLKNQ